MKRRFWRITVDTNPEDCNLSCIMCEEHSPYSDFKQKLFAATGIHHRRMPAEWIDKIFREAHDLGVREIIPSTRKFLVPMLNYAERKGLLMRDGDVRRWVGEEL